MPVLEGAGSPSPEQAFATLKHLADVFLQGGAHVAADSGVVDAKEPQRGATLIVEVDRLGGDASTRLRLRGPGIESAQPLAVTGLSQEFWLWRTRLQAALPRGVELLLVCGTQVAAIPRSTRITLEV